MSVSTTGNEMFVISLDIDPMGKATERIPDLEKSAQLHNTLLQGLFPEIRVARLHVPAGVLEKYQTALVSTAVVVICAFELRQYVTLAVHYPLYELVTEGLLRALQILKSPLPPGP